MQTRPCRTQGRYAWARDGIVPLISRKLVALLLGVTLACDGGPSGLSTGNLAVSVSGLPTGSPANLTVSGPEGYSQGVTSTQTLTGLTPGTYTVTASAVTVASAIYAPTPETQSVGVGGSTANASVFYSTGGGSLSVTISGLGTSTDAAVTITGPNSYTRNLTASETVTGLSAGTYTVTAQDVVASGGTTHTPAPATQDVAVPATGTGNATVNYAPPSSGSLNLRIAGLYVTQSAQTYDGSVPLVKDRNGYLRVFAVANRTNTSAPAVRVQIYNSSNVVVSTVVIPAPGLAVPTAVDESSLSYSWNTSISGALIQPGFRIEAEVDPSPGTVAESDETDNLLAPPAPAVQTMPTLDVTFVPVIQQRHAARGDVGNVTNTNKDEFLSLTRKMHPIAGYNAIVRAPYTTTTTDTLQDDNGNQAWGTILAEIDAIRAVENPSRYYYGVAKVSYTSGVAGVAYVSNQNGEGSALGWDYLPSAGAVVAHELGHNWGRNHAPCGGPTGLDNSYPHVDGSIGVYGLDVAAQSLKPASTSDIMGYCEPKWIGDYTYKAVMNYLLSPLPSAPVVSASVSEAVQPCLLVWGHIRNGEMVLEPAFHVNTRPRLPQRPGPYTVQASTEDGASLFSLSFTPSEIADARGDQQSFVFAVPVSDAQASRLAALRLSGQGREARRARARQVVPDVQLKTTEPAEVRRVAGGKIGVRWNAESYPMAMVRDVETGEVLSFARGGSVDVASYRREVSVVLSDGVRSTARRLAVGR
jgi:hypothetical protein